MKNQEPGNRMQNSVKNEARVLYPESQFLNPDLLLSRVRWRCRRGMLELDIVLMRFVDAHYAKLSHLERETFEEFLDMADNPLWDLISGKTDAASEEGAALAELIRSV